MYNKNNKRNCKGNNKRGNGKGNAAKTTTTNTAPAELDSTGRDNNPGWYFSNPEIADQVSRIAMRNFAGKDLTNFAGSSLNARTNCINTIWVNPSPGTQVSYTEGGQKSAINMAGFKLYTKVGALTGRTLPYLPSDMSTMILAFGELISTVEFIRRAFGVAYTYSQRNRAYPIQAIKAMGINAEDLVTNFSTYRNRFNMLITRINQLPIPKDVAYFDKCASIYEKIYTDSTSPMASSIILVPATTWMIDETSYEGGTILKTTPLCMKKQTGNAYYANVNGINFEKLSYYFNVLEEMVDRLLASETLNKVYADLINYANKLGKQFWIFDYLHDGYSVVPEYNANFLLQLHNATFMGAPQSQILVASSPDMVITPENDVYPNPDDNTLFYDPVFITNGTTTSRIATKEVVVDFLTDNPTVEDRVEALRFTALNDGVPVGVNHDVFSPIPADTGITAYVDTALPDHYFVGFIAWNNTAVASDARLQTGTFIDYTLVPGSYYDSRVFGQMSQIDWAPLIYVKLSNDVALIGDINYFTSVDAKYIKPILDFIGLDLYDLR
jgi:hypothetical protein